MDWIIRPVFKEDFTPEGQSREIKGGKIFRSLRIKICIIPVTIVGLLSFLPSCDTGKSPESIQGPEKHLYWGDLHNHNSIGYARGSLERSFDIAGNHLDFYCFTPHTQWPDMPEMPGNASDKWKEGFSIARDNWERVRKYVEDYNKPGKFVTFLGYEWHSSAWGDVCMILPNDTASLLYFDKLSDIQDYARNSGAILIPHHPAYINGWRGQDWNLLDTTVSPVVEIYSEHGNAESDRAPLPYIRHSMGGRYTPNTIQALWESGVKAGVLASTDDHLGYPGAYGEGLVAVYADSLTRESVMEAVKARHTYGVTADRIELEFRVNGHLMGETVAGRQHNSIRIKVKGRDEVDRVEILKNNRVIYRDHPVDRVPGDDKWSEPVLCRVEFGWGPWGSLNMTRICDWKMEARIRNGKILSVTPCFQSGPFDETRRNRVEWDETACRVTSYTSRQDAFAERATNSFILEIRGSPETELTLDLKQPAGKTITRSLKELAESNSILFTGSFTSESLIIQRLVFHDNYFTEFSYKDPAPAKRGDYYYTRVTQSNGSLAWSSPVWIE